MKLPENYTVLFKNVKHVGIRVSHDQRVRIVVPAWLPERHLDHILRTKNDWIQKHLRRMRMRKPPVPLAENEILLRGKIFRYEESPSAHHSVELDEEHSVIRAGPWFLKNDGRQIWYRNEAKQFIGQRVQNLAAQYGFHFNKITFRSQKTRWGSCSKRKNLSFNWKLIKAPLFVIDYLILHELVHTELMNHSREYWQRIQSLSPDYKKASQWLKVHGREL